MDLVTSTWGAWKVTLALAGGFVTLATAGGFLWSAFTKPAADVDAKQDFRWEAHDASHDAMSEQRSAQWDVIELQMGLVQDTRTDVKEVRASVNRVVEMLKARDRYSLRAEDE